MFQLLATFLESELKACVRVTVMLRVCCQGVMNVGVHRDWLRLSFRLPLF